MSKKVITLRHMEDKRHDHVAQFLDQSDVIQIHTNPAHGVPLPENTDDLDALVIYGGIQSANDGNDRPYIAQELKWIANWLEKGKPILGICLGAQLIAKCLGGEVKRHPEGLIEVGFRQVKPPSTSDDFLGGARHFYQWHNEGFTLPDDCELLAQGEDFPNQAFRYRSNTYGLQFHPEVTRPVMLTWLNSAGYVLSNRGAHSLERQCADETRHGDAMGQWCWNFMEQWSKTW